MTPQTVSTAKATASTRSRFLRFIRTASEVAQAAILTWIFFLMLQVLALHFVAEGF